MKGQKGNQNYIDLRGKRFGLLVAVEPTDQRSYKGSVMWRCQCDCGNTVIYSQDGLVNGNYKSCGCQKHSGVKAAHESLTFVEGTCVQWLEKRTKRADNTSGHAGVSPTPKGKWYAHIGMQGERYHLGIYDDFDEAVEAREYARQLLHEDFTEQYHEWKKSADADPAWATEHPFRSKRYGHAELRNIVREHMGLA